MGVDTGAAEALSWGAGVSDALEPGRGLETDGLLNIGFGLGAFADRPPAVMLVRAVVEGPGLEMTEGETLKA